MAKNSFSIGVISVRPFDHSSKLAFDKECTDLFDDRNHFILFKKQTHIAVQVCLFNDNNLGRRALANRFCLEVLLQDEDTGETVSLKTIRGEMRSIDNVLSFRVDLPVEYKDIDPSHRYTVLAREYNRTVCKREIRFYDLSNLRLLPTRWYTVREAYLNAEFPWSTDKVRSIGDTARYDITATFELELNEKLRNLTEPEIEIRTISPTGKEDISVLRPHKDEFSLADSYIVNHRVHLDSGKSGVHYVEIRCMGHAFSGFLFSSKGDKIDGAWSGEYLGSHRDYTVAEGERRFDSLIEKMEKENAASTVESIPLPEIDEASTENAKMELDSLIGISSVKGKLRQYTQLIRFNKLRRDSGLPSLSIPLHCMFLGSPGTGKTTVAGIIGKELKELGILSKGHVVVRERSTLLGQYYHSESEKTLQALEEAQGGILFIDEAYQLCQPQDPRDPGRFVIEALMTALADESRRDWMLILAGYDEPMHRLFDINPGLRSRIPESNIYKFEDFSETELTEIGESYLAKHAFEFSNGAREAFRRRISCDYAMRDNTFGNARHVINLIQTEIIPALAARVSEIENPTNTDLVTIMPSDINMPAIKERVEHRSVGFAV